MQGGSQQQPALFAITLVHTHSPALMILLLKMPFIPAIAGCDPGVEALQHLLTNLWEVLGLRTAGPEA